MTRRRVVMVPLQWKPLIYVYHVAYQVRMTGLTVYYTVTSVSKLYVQCSAVVLTISLIPILIHTCRLVGGAAKVLSASQEPRSLFSNLILNKSH